MTKDKQTGRKKIGLLGGSFNPPHEGHLNSAETVRRACGLDEVWLMVTPGNPHKDPKSYAPYEDRLAMCRLLAEGRPWLVTSAIEKEMGTCRTYDTLTALSSREPAHDFVWIMGSDNLRDFHKWSHWQDIIMNWPIAVNIRKDQEPEALNSPAARYAARFRTAEPAALGKAPSWCLFDSHDSGLSSRHIRTAIADGRINNVSNLFNALAGKPPPRPQTLRQVAHYIAWHKLYDYPPARPAQKPPI